MLEYYLITPNPEEVNFKNFGNAIRTAYSKEEAKVQAQAIAEQTGFTNLMVWKYNGHFGGKVTAVLQSYTYNNKGELIPSNL